MSGGSGQDRRGGHPAPGSCAVPGCRTPWTGTANTTKAEQPVEKWRGTKLCGMHYQRWRRYGNPEMEPMGNMGGRRRKVSQAEIVRLRRMVGVPDRGPTKLLTARWTRQESQ